MPVDWSKGTYTSADMHAAMTEARETAISRTVSRDVIGKRIRDVLVTLLICAACLVAFLVLITKGFDSSKRTDGTRHLEKQACIETPTKQWIDGNCVVVLVH